MPGAIPYSDVGGLAAPGTIGVPDDYGRVNADPNAFGAGVAAAGQKLGQATEQAGGTAVDIATQWQALHNKITADDAVNQWGDNARRILSGDPNNPNDHGYLGLQGKDALAARSSVQQQLQDSYQDQTQGMNPAQKLLFDQENRRYLNLISGQVDSHATQQNLVYQQQTAQASVQNSLKTASLSASQGDDAAWKAGVLDAAGKQAAFDRGRGADDQTVQFNAGKVLSEGAKQRTLQLEAQSPLAAQAFIDSNKGMFDPDTLDSLQKYLQPKVRNAQAIGLGDGQLNAAVAQGGVGGAPPALSAVVHQLESGGSMAPGQTGDGGAAHGPMQVHGPALQDVNAKLGTNYTTADLERDPAIGQKVGETYLGMQVEKYGRPDYALGAYNQGPGAMDAAIASGKGVAGLPGGGPQYVENGMKLLQTAQGSGAPGGQKGPPQPQQTQADFFKANYDQISDRVRQQALALHPDDPSFADLAVSRVQTRMGSEIRQQQQHYGADRDTLLQAVNGDFTKGTMPTTIEQLTATPQASQAWDRVQVQQPALAHEVATRLLAANAKPDNGDAKTYGAGFLDTFNRIHLPDGDPNKITDPSQLYGSVGQPGGLTMSGLEKARQELAGRNTTDGEAETAMRGQFFKNARAQISGSDDGLGLKDPKGDDIMLRFMARAYPGHRCRQKGRQVAGAALQPGKPGLRRQVDRIVQADAGAAHGRHAGRDLRRRRSFGPERGTVVRSDEAGRHRRRLPSRQAVARGCRGCGGEAGLHP